MNLFDTHAHLDGFVANGTVEAVLDRARAAGVESVCVVGSSAVSNELVADLVRARPKMLVGAAGLDRDQAELSPDMERLGELLEGPGMVAVGEIGLDYHYSGGTAGAQRGLFGRMLEFALERRKPVIVHSREADDDTVAMLSEFAAAWRGRGGASPPGILHCFTGGAEFAERLVAAGLMISFSGIVSFNNAGPLREVARRIPDERLLIETDCPYLAPKPYRGRVNEPAYVARVAEVLAETRGVKVEELAALTRANARRVFQLEDGS